MTRLSYQQRKKLPKSDFALPAKVGKRGEKRAGKGAYPIPDKSHARDALARVSADGTPAEKREVRAAVHHKYPEIGERKTAHNDGRFAHRGSAHA